MDYPTRSCNPPVDPTVTWPRIIPTVRRASLERTSSQTARWTICAQALSWPSSATATTSALTVAARKRDTGLAATIIEWQHDRIKALRATA